MTSRRTQEREEISRGCRAHGHTGRSHDGSDGASSINREVATDDGPKAYRAARADQAAPEAWGGPDPVRLCSRWLSAQVWRPSQTPSATWARAPG